MIDLVIDAFSIAFVFLTYYFVALGRNYEDQIEKNSISFFMLGLLFVAFRIGAEIAGSVGVHSYLLNTPIVAVFTVLTPLFFIMGLKKISDSKQEAEEATANLKEREKFMKIIKKK